MVIIVIVVMMMVLVLLTSEQSAEESLLLWLYFFLRLSFSLLIGIALIFVLLLSFLCRFFLGSFICFGYVLSLGNCFRLGSFNGHRTLLLGSFLYISSFRLVLLISNAVGFLIVYGNFLLGGILCEFFCGSFFLIFWLRSICRKECVHEHIAVKRL